MPLWKPKEGRWGTHIRPSCLALAFSATPPCTVYGTWVWVLKWRVTPQGPPPRSEAHTPMFRRTHDQEPPIRICVHTALKCVPIDTCVWALLNMLFGYNAYFSYFHCYSISTPTSAVEWWKLVCPACYGLLCEVMASCVM